MGSVKALLFRALKLPIPSCHPGEPLKFTALRRSELPHRPAPI